MVSARPRPTDPTARPHEQRLTAAGATGSVVDVAYLLSLPSATSQLVLNVKGWARSSVRGW